MIVSDTVGIFSIIWLALFIVFLGATLFLGYRRNELNEEHKKQLRHAIKALYVLVPLMVIVIVFLIVVGRIG